MPNHNVGWLFLCICVIGNVMAIDLTRLYGLHNKREIGNLGNYDKSKSIKDGYFQLDILN